MEVKKTRIGEQSTKVRGCLVSAIKCLIDILKIASESTC
jgi:hypothetical protein